MMTNPENLVPLMSRTKEERVAIARKGGSTPSPKRSIAIRLRQLRKKGLTDATSLQIWEALAVPELSSMDQYLYLKKFESICHTVQEKAIFARMMHDWHKMHHGDKKVTENKNINVNINLDVEEKEGVIEALLNKDED